MVDYFHSQNVKVVCWITSTINNDSTNFMEGKQKGYYLSDGKLIKWWRGHGALLDYSNPAALDWWHKQMDLVLDIGVDGWKCDGTDPYVWELIDSYGYKGHVTEREYADFYYRDFFYYTKQKRGDALIMARPVDNQANLVYIDYAPHDVMFSGWVGDQTGNFDGLKVALNNIMHSAWKNYLNFGMDIGGYRTDSSSGPFGRSKEVFIRWFQLGAFVPLMENGGNGEHRPWKFGNDVVETYRVFVNIHMNLVPFFLNAGAQCYAKNISVITPMSRKEPLAPTTYDYVLFDDIFVSPFTENGTIKSIVKFPGKSADSWSYWFNNSQIYQGGAQIKSFNCSYDEFPVFVKSGAILPLQVENNYTKLGTNYSKDYFSILINNPARGIHRKKVHEYKSTGFEVTYAFNDIKNTFDLYISAHAKHKFVIIIDNLKSDMNEFFLRSSISQTSLSEIEENLDFNEFWASSGNSAHRVNSLNRLFIKINDSASKGLYVSIRK